LLSYMSIFLDHLIASTAYSPFPLYITSIDTPWRSNPQSHAGS